MSTAIVTGGAKGIGKAIVEELASMGIKVMINYNTSEEKAKNLKNELIEKGYNVEICRADVSKREEVKKLVEYTKSKFGDINILVNNAGIAEHKMFCDVTDADWSKIINTNLYSVFCMTQEVLPDMVHKKQGCIINISSIFGLVGASCESIYSVTKAGIDGMTKSLAKELGPSNIRVNGVAPGMIDTEMNNDLSKEDIQNIKEQTPLGKIGKPEEIAKCVRWLVEDTYTTGQIISPNGGWVI